MVARPPAKMAAPHSRQRGLKDKGKEKWWQNPPGKVGAHEAVLVADGNRGHCRGVTLAPWCQPLVRQVRVLFSISWHLLDSAGLAAAVPEPWMCWEGAAGKKWSLSTDTRWPGPDRLKLLHGRQVLQNSLRNRFWWENAAFWVATAVSPEKPTWNSICLEQMPREHLAWALQLFKGISITPTCPVIPFLAVALGLKVLVTSLGRDRFGIQ